MHSTCAHATIAADVTGGLMELTGTLQAFPLAELLEMLQASSMRGVLEIDSQHGRSCVYVDKGNVYHAVCGNETGNAAVWRLFEETNAFFAVRTNVVADHTTITDDLSALIAEGQRRAELWAQIYRRIPNLDAVPTLCPQTASQCSLKDHDWTVLTAINGVRSIREIIEHLASEPLDVCYSLLHLLDGEIIYLAHATPSRPATSDGPNGLLKRPGMAAVTLPTPSSSLCGSGQRAPVGLFGRLRRATAAD